MIFMINYPALTTVNIMGMRVEIWMSKIRETVTTQENRTIKIP